MIEQLTFLPADDHGIRRAPAERQQQHKEVSAPLAKDGQSLVLGSLKTRARYEPRCLVCDAWLTVDELHYGVAMCAPCVRKRGGDTSSSSV